MTDKQTEQLEQLGQIIDSLDSLAHALNIAIPAEHHVEVLRKSLPIKVEKLKSIYIEITGENPWF